MIAKDSFFVLFDFLFCFVFCSAVKSIKLMSWSNCYLFAFVFAALKILTTEQPKDAETVNIACPALFPPLHGYLECSRPIENSTMTPTGRLRITNRPGSQCILRCPTRYDYFTSFLLLPCISPLRLKHFIDHKLFSSFSSFTFHTSTAIVLLGNFQKPVVKMETGTEMRAEFV